MTSKSPNPIAGITNFKDSEGV